MGSDLGNAKWLRQSLKGLLKLPTINLNCSLKKGLKGLKKVRDSKKIVNKWNNSLLRYLNCGRWHTRDSLKQKQRKRGGHRVGSINIC